MLGTKCEFFGSSLVSLMLLYNVDIVTLQIETLFMCKAIKSNTW